MVENPKPYVFILTIFVMKWMWYRLVYPVGVLAFESGDTFCGRQFRCGKFFSCEKAGQKLGMARGSYPPRKLSNISKRDNRSLQFYYFAWLYGNKGVIVGRAIGEF